MSGNDKGEWGSLAGGVRFQAEDGRRGCACVGGRWPVFSRVGGMQMGAGEVIQDFSGWLDRIG